MSINPLAETAELESPVSSRMTIITAFTAFIATALTAATFEYMMVPLQTDLGISVDGITGVTLIPVAASLLAVFVVGALGDRIGLRRTMVAGSILYILGAVLVTLSTSMGTLLLGRGLTGIGGVTLGITGIATLNAICRDTKRRSAVFGYLAAIVPATFMVAALVGALLTDWMGWRVVPGLWILLGIVILVALSVTPKIPLEARPRGELVTPILAGLVLSGFGIAATTVSSDRGLAAISATIAVAALASLAVLMLRLKRPTLDLRVLRPRGSALIVGAILLTTAVNFYFFTNLFIQYRFRVPLVQVSLLFIIPQLVSVAGGILGGRMSSRWSASLAATIALTASALGVLCFFFVRIDSSVWVPIITLTIMALPNSAAVGPLTQLLLDGAPADGSGAASSVRSAVWSVGGILGSIILGKIAYDSFTASLTDALQKSGLDFSAATAVAARVRAGELVANIEDELSATAPQTSLELSGQTSGLGIAQIHALHLVAGVGTALYLCAAVLLLVLYLRRRSERHS